MEDSAGSGGDLRTAELTGVDFAIGDSVMGSDLLALLAVDTFRPASFFQKVKTSIIGRELFLEIFDSVSLHFLSPLHYQYSIKSPCCQGIIA